MNKVYKFIVATVLFLLVFTVSTLASKIVFLDIVKDTSEETQKGCYNLILKNYPDNQTIDYDLIATIDLGCRLGASSLAYNIVKEFDR